MGIKKVQKVGTIKLELGKYALRGANAAFAEALLHFGPSHLVDQHQFIDHQSSSHLNKGYYRSLKYSKHQFLQTHCKY